MGVEVEAKQIRLRWASRCAGCEVDLPPRTEAWWISATKETRCLGCLAVAELRAGTDVKPAGEVAAPVASPPITVGQAGASARREHQRRAERERARKQAEIDDMMARRAQVKVEMPILGRVGLAFIPKPKMTPDSQSTKAWEVGAAGEERVAEVLASTDAIALHDRRIPGSRANIDHIAVCPSGVFVIDAKKYSGKIEKRDLGGWHSTDERLYVNGRDRSKLLKGMTPQCDVVRTALGDQADRITVAGVLCFVGSEWPFLRPKPIRFDSAICVWPAALTKLVGAEGPLDQGQIESIGAKLAAALPPA